MIKKKRESFVSQKESIQMMKSIVKREKMEKAHNRVLIDVRRRIHLEALETNLGRILEGVGMDEN